MLIFAPQKFKSAMKTVIIAILVLLICVLLLAIRVLLVKGGRFPDGHIGHSEAMRKRGIGCASGRDDDDNK